MCMHVSRRPPGYLGREAGQRDWAEFPEPRSPNIGPILDSTCNLNFLSHFLTAENKEQEKKKTERRKNTKQKGYQPANRLSEPTNQANLINL